MSGPHPAVADVRRAVRGALQGLRPGSVVLVAASGGPDSMALAAATSFVSARLALRPYAVVVDHQLQAGSASVAQRAADQLSKLGYEHVSVTAVTVNGVGGPEAAARSARYAAIDAVAEEVEAAAILLGHTLDDQAESVLLGLARGSGAGSIKGMSDANGLYRRPFLNIRRAQTRQACVELSLDVWDDPHNEDQGFTRVRVRQQVMPVIESELGPGVAESLARTARLLQADDAALQAWAGEVRNKAALTSDGGLALDVRVLNEAPRAVRIRVIRAALLELGVPGGDLRASHLLDVDALVSGWKGQGEVHLPGSIGASRSYGRLQIARAHR
ncbi:MAG: tRNA lysidine(34) synthetase TilS [Actinomycetes bacterium]